jgi:hypothetical protein
LRRACPSALLIIACGRVKDEKRDNFLVRRGMQKNEEATWSMNTYFGT